MVRPDSLPAPKSLFEAVRWPLIRAGFWVTPQVLILRGLDFPLQPLWKPSTRHTCSAPCSQILMQGEAQTLLPHHKFAYARNTSLVQGSLFKDHLYSVLQDH